MRIGIIDFGTNTLRLDIFETEDREYRSIYDFAIYSKIVENTVGTSLSQEGIEHVIQAIEEHQQACRHYRCDRVECFSTASLRFIDNAESVLEQVEFRTGIKIRMISGDEEANYDYLALRSISDSESGIGCDLGGGSIQVFTYDKNGPVKSASYPLGSSRTAKRFVKGEIPTAEEIADIKKCVGDSLSETGFVPCCGTLFAMGGTAKAIQKLCKTAMGKSGKLFLSDINIALSLLSERPDEALELIADVAPKRKRTLVPGMAILAGVMEKMGCDGMEVHAVGVREGFMESILNDDSKPEPNLLDLILGSI
ncbi:MAG: hypothetical protein IKL57_06840 [Oscillospiraceae bacterium]|nr:hypothetical protein [Oscillospiraceae bacterium]